MNNVTAAPPVECRGTGWLQRCSGAARTKIASGVVLRWVNELSGIHRGVILRDPPDGAAEIVSIAWSEFLARPAQVADAVRDGVVIELTGRPGGAVIGYVTFWDDAVMAAGPVSYSTREGAGNGWRPVTRTFADPAHVQAVRT